MIISVSNTLNHEVNSNKRAKMSNEEIEQLVMKSIEKLGLQKEDVKWNEQGQLELCKSNSLKLHSLTLQMEKLGLNLKMTKQTLIDIY
jgi:citrate lyase gamma subunit